MATALPPQSPFSSAESFLTWLKGRSKTFWISAIVGAWLLGALLWMILFPYRPRREEPANRPAATQVQPKATPGEPRPEAVEPGAK